MTIGAWLVRKLPAELLLGVIATLFLNSCTASKVEVVPKESGRLELPPSGELEVHVKALAPVGEIMPVEVSITNLADRARVVKSSSAAGISESGERAAEFSLESSEVIVQSDALLKALGGSVPWVPWADAMTSLRTYYIGNRDNRSGLPPGYLEKNQPLSGYVFLPNRRYLQFELTVHNQLSGYDEVITVPWRNAYEGKGNRAPN